MTYLIKLDKESPSTSTAKSSRRDSLNERVINTQIPTQGEIEAISSKQSQHVPIVPVQSPPIHHLQDKQELPVRSNK